METAIRLVKVSVAVSYMRVDQTDGNLIIKRDGVTVWLQTSDSHALSDLSDVTCA